jgi:hypothetical protein
MYQSHLYGDLDKSLEKMIPLLQEMYNMDHNKIHIYVQRFIFKIILYNQTNPPNGFAWDPREYIRCSLRYGPSFANWLKKARQAMMIKSLSWRLTKDNETFISSMEDNIYNLPLDKKIYDYDSFIHEQHLIPFKEEADDFQWAFKDVDVEEEWLEHFRTSARSLFLKYKLRKIKHPDGNEKATWISDSVTQTDDGPKLNRKLFRELASEDKLIDLYESSKKLDGLRFKRQSVFVAPGNARDTWQCYPETLFKVKRVSHLLRQILEPLPTSAMASPKKAWARRKRIDRKDGIYLMFDYKKCGLTVNRTLLKIISEELNFIYPGEGYDELSHFDNISVQNGSMTLHPLRGVGLGNCNEGITLIQCVVGSMVADLAGLDAVFFNDDGIFVSDEDEVRSSFAWVFTAISKLGMIINLKKTIISDCNVFCEDYFIARENMSYEKVQSLIIPFSEVFFKLNISQAKVLYHSLEEGLIGRRVVIDLASSCTQWWGYEFHHSEVWWPFEFGGWRRYGSSSINECLNAIYDPWDFCPGVLHGSIPYFREWAYYLVTSQQIREINRYTTNIRYRQFIENPFKELSNNYPHSDLCQNWIEQLGMRTNPQINKNLDDLYNVRGLKNAKPHIKMGKARKLETYRKYVWRKFLRFRYGERRVFLGHPSEILNILRFLRNNEVTPNMYEPPKFAVLKWEDVPERDQVSLGRVMYPDHITLGTGDRLSILKAIESVNNGYLLEDARPDRLRSLAQSLESRPVVSNHRFKRSCKSFVDLPEWVKLFFGKRKLAVIFYTSKYGKSPISMVDLPFSRELERSLRNPIALIFPNASKKYWDLLKLVKHRPDRDDILDTLHCREYFEESDFLSALEALYQFLNWYKYESVRQQTETDLFDNCLLEATIDYDLIDEQLGEKDFDDILDEYDFDVGFMSEDSYPADDDYDLDFDLSPSRSTLAALREPLDYDV